MNSEINNQMIEKLITGISGFDHVSLGGLPKGRTTLVSGTAGSAKTVFAVNFLCAGISMANENGVFVTFEESPQDIRRNMLSFGWNIQKWEEENRWAFVDASMDTDDETVEVGSYDLGALLARIEHAIKKTNATRVSIDSLGAVFGRFSSQETIRRELFRMAVSLKQMNVTAIMTAERTREDGEIARYGVEEFVADNVIIMRNRIEAEKRRRTIEILKFRGTSHNKGEYPFTILPTEGIVVIPLSALELKQDSSNIRISSGNEVLDEMCGGGFFRDSVVLVSGATGNGKTLMATEFVSGGVAKNERSLLFAFEESREQLMRNATGWGVNYKQIESDGLLQIVCRYPEVMGLEDHLIMIKKAIEEFKPNRVCVDSLSALERVSTQTGYREFVIGLTSFIKHQEIAGLFTSTTPTLMGGTSITEGHISTITDTIILLRYVEIFGEVRRGLTVLKMRGSMHDKRIREFTIDGNGMHVGKPFHNISGILSGSPVVEKATEITRFDEMFSEKKA